MLFCTGTVPSLCQGLYCKQQRMLRFSVSNCTKCKVHKFRVATWTSVDLALPCLNFTKLKESPHLPIHSACHKSIFIAQEPHLSAWPICPWAAAIGPREQPLHSTWARPGQQDVLRTSPLLVEEHADWESNAQETPLHWSVHSRHFLCETTKHPSGWNRPQGALFS